MDPYTELTKASLSGAYTAESRMHILQFSCFTKTLQVRVRERHFARIFEYGIFISP